MLNQEEGRRDLTEDHSHGRLSTRDGPWETEVGAWFSGLYSGAEFSAFSRSSSPWKGKATSVPVLKSCT
jgi:hypothetical protein